ncbi:hypothetical protein IQ22_04070 [Pseudomonas duriflava]|uniref:Uncharacterized protein n=1 Tax=Pseudomonas duriflava TaxID=459528 RepID=A0A562PXZ9_9PSED|nr:hypothetical protein IQ22_04070 [Pseudomonas duriflava]
MEQHDASMKSAMEMHDSCFDEQKSAHLGGKMCKSGEQCQANTLVQTSAFKTPCVPIAPPIQTALPERAVSLTPSDVWRPPRA